ncbi:MAG: rRNA maturation RNase YbeY [Cycloclasticus sp.]
MSMELQVASDFQPLPSQQQFECWVQLATQQRPEAEVLVRVVDEVESAELNVSYRQKEGPTNVLSFPFELPEGLPADALDDDCLGDLVICAPLVEQQAQQQGKPVIEHWAHLVVHGCLHLQGYDHIDDADATVMESLEIELLNSIGIDNPYEG